MKVNTCNFWDLDVVVKAKQKTMLTFFIRGVIRNLLVYYDETTGLYSLPALESDSKKRSQKAKIIEDIKVYLTKIGFKEKESPLEDLLNLDLEENKSYSITYIDKSGIIYFRDLEKEEDSSYARIGKGTILYWSINHDPKRKYPHFKLDGGKTKLKVTNAFTAMYTFLVEWEDGIRYNLQIEFSKRYYKIDTKLDPNSKGKFALATRIK